MILEQVPTLVIAGVNKSGSTSLFRYLARHPQVCPSTVKETHFFGKYDGPMDEAARTAFADYFRDCDRSAARILMESTPRYFSGGERIAQRIRTLLPDAKLLVLLREPVARLRSHFRSTLTYDNRLSRLSEGLTFEDFATRCLDAEQDDRIDRRFRHALHQGRYADHADVWARYFRPEQLLYVFFDDLAADPRATLQRIARHLGIDPAFYEDFEFTVENRTRSFRSRGLQTVAHRLNMMLEPVLNRHPRVRELVRRTYWALNQKSATGSSAAELSDETRRRLEDYYAASNAAMARLLAATYGIERFPDWMEEAAAARRDSPAGQAVPDPGAASGPPAPAGGGQADAPGVGAGGGAATGPAPAHRRLRRRPPRPRGPRPP